MSSSVISANNMKISTLSVISSALSKYISRMEEDYYAGSNGVILDGVEEDGFFAGEQTIDMANNILNICRDNGYNIEEIESYQLIQLIWLYFLLKINNDKNHNVYFGKILKTYFNYNDNNKKFSEKDFLDILCFIIDSLMRSNKISNFDNSGILNIVKESFGMLISVTEIKTENYESISEFVSLRNIYEIETEILILNRNNNMNGYTVVSVEKFVKDNNYLNIKIDSIVGLIIERYKKYYIYDYDKINASSLYEKFYIEFNCFLDSMRKTENMKLYSKLWL